VCVCVCVFAHVYKRVLALVNHTRPMLAGLVQSGRIT
jgi:hypothetical protein